MAGEGVFVTIIFGQMLLSTLPAYSVAEVPGYTKVLSCQRVYAIVIVEYCTDQCRLFCLGVVSGDLGQRKLLIACFSQLFLTP